MRAGGITLQQTLTTEAASVLKHSLSLARRRGHAQVTPLHVAATLLGSRAGVLRRACLKSQSQYGPTSSHPLHSRALELCFNVALNRLPTSPGLQILYGQPSLSNALIAALKRAQAHQKRGCIEQQQQQQQPLLAIKVELEQLILSILDDPSVSRVMREAGFSSTIVKNNLVDSVSSSPVFQYCYNNSSSGGVYSSPCSPNSAADVNNLGNFSQNHLLAHTSEKNPLVVSPLKQVTSSHFVMEEDIKLVFEVLLRKKRRNAVVIGDSLSINEGLVSKLMVKIEKGDVPEELKSVHFIRFQFSSVPLRFMRREEVEMNISELKRKVEAFISGGRGVIIYTGDLKWAVDDHVNGDQVEGKYNPVDHLITEIGRLLCDCGSSNTKVWLLTTANYQTYIKCQMKQPSLEIQWNLQAVSVPSGGLGLSLNATSVHESRMVFTHNPSQERKPYIIKEEPGTLPCCAECTTNYHKEAALLKSGHQLNPSWLQPQGSESLQRENLAELRRKWGKLCHGIHQGRSMQNQMDSSSKNHQCLIGKNYSCSSSYPWWPKHDAISPDISISFTDSKLKYNHSVTSVAKFRRQQSCHIDFKVSDRYHKNQVEEPNLDSLKNIEGKEVKVTLALGNSLSLDLEKSENKTPDGNTLCKILQEKVPWQSERIPSIVQVLSKSSKSKTKENTWLLIHGNDSIGKRRLALAIAVKVLGSAEYLLCLNMRNRDNKQSPCSEILERALSNQEKLLVLVEDVDCADAQFIKFLNDGFKTDKFGEVSYKVGELIFILTKGDPRRYQEDGNKLKTSVIQMKLQVDKTSPTFDHQKRKAECEIFSKNKNARISEKEAEKGIDKKDLNSPSSSSTLDLNIKAATSDDDGNDEVEYSPISSDVTLETANDPQNPLGFLEMIENRFTFNQEDGRMKEILLSKLKMSFKEVLASENIADNYDEIHVGEGLLKELLAGCGSFVDNLFDKWLNDVFQMSLRKVVTEGKEAIVSRIRLSLAGEESGVEDDGFMDSNLPKKIQ